MGSIGELFDHTHDLWFDLDEVIFYPQSQSLKVPLHEKAGWRGLKIFAGDKNEFNEKYTILIKNVLDVDLLDSQKVGSYDVNTIEYEKNRREIKINTGIPLKFKVKVADPEIVLLEKADI